MRARKAETRVDISRKGAFSGRSVAIWAQLMQSHPTPVNEPLKQLLCSYARNHTVDLFKMTLHEIWNQDQGHARVTLHCAQVFLASWKQATSRDTRVGWLLTRIFQMHMIAAWGNEPCAPDTGGLYSDWVERYLVALQAPTVFMGCLAIVHVVFVVLLSIARNLRCASILLWNSERWQQCHAQLSVWCAQMDQGHARVCVWFSLCWMCLPNEPGDMQTWLQVPCACAACQSSLWTCSVLQQQWRTFISRIYRSVCVAWAQRAMPVISRTHLRRHRRFLHTRRPGVAALRKASQVFVARRICVRTLTSAALLRSVLLAMLLPWGVLAVCLSVLSTTPRPTSHPFSRASFCRAPFQLSSCGDIMS